MRVTISSLSQCSLNGLDGEMWSVDNAQELNVGAVAMRGLLALRFRKRAGVDFDVIVENLNGDHSPERRHGLLVNSIS
jgi:hypothetical protein